jgi:hypothetical protein
VRKLGINTLNIQSESFAIFILTHGRPTNVKTISALQRAGYTGKLYLVIDDEDKTAEKYIANFGKDRVVVFNKKEMADQVDEGNNFNERRTITHARNACFKIAKELGIKYFMELDDDYISFEYRYVSKCGQKLNVHKIKDLDRVLCLYIQFFKETGFHSIAFAQGGDFIGGVENRYATRKPLIRKCMNSFVCSTDRPFRFIGAMNEDVNTYTTLGSRGLLFGTIPIISLVQTATQSQKSGITDMYLRFGTYCKAFTTVMMHPSAVRVSMLNSNNPRIHHSIKWENAVPVIISERHKKSIPIT